MFLTTLPYLAEPVYCNFTKWFYLRNIHKLVILSEWFYYDVSSLSYYGTITDPLGEEFVNIKEWDILTERAFFYALGAKGIVKGVASLYGPTAEGFDGLQEV